MTQKATPPKHWREIQHWGDDKQAAFKKAADRSTGIAKVLFEDLRDKDFFADKWWLKENRAREAFNMTMTHIRSLATIDRIVELTLHDLDIDLGNAQYKYRKATNQLCGH